MSTLLLFNKPFNVLSQFTDNTGRPTLKEFVPVKDVYPAGRLDRDSEGLLLLTDDGKLQKRISDPKHKMQKTYLAQVEGEVTDEAIELLSRGITLNDGPTKPASAKKIPEPELWPRVPPIRERKNTPTSWIEIIITEGRNRQVRRMTAAVGFPTLRLVRSAIGPWNIDQIAQGTFKELEITAQEMQDF